MKSIWVLLCLLSLAACDRNRGVDNPKDVQLKVSKRSAQSGATIDYTQFKFSDRKRFEDLMEARIDAVERGLDTLKKESKLGVIDGSGVSSASTPPPELVEKRLREITKVDHQKELLEDQLDFIDDVKPDQWDRYKDGFRSDLLALEKAYQDLYVAKNE